ncbi:hypothetical protein WL88_08625 [Burkholderia diffusa]|uniref:Uncharacterized protein n=1 Tax=Burkholderia diffusa TaxID=488732 RepID=A0AAW3PLA1_9BURK|nr:hypothetical protein [Burkholderia diffusa]KVM99094.1 hypothetical protein WJ62_18260 [Burkholderia diffusa]KWF27443.1 hypothetical protein WL85_30130 [Burkholderia diffusa]KWF43854.1 hypothetical protein WL86_10045 [Burkholderia diffusa]KWF54715.1 hypothetical protein WL87_10125 [Burkholderia diffusa]KWF57591.1 hypothetical protein WL88_08625 [Burkholderia diffusa]
MPGIVARIPIEEANHDAYFGQENWPLPEFATEAGDSPDYADAAPSGHRHSPIRGARHKS